MTASSRRALVLLVTALLLAPALAEASRQSKRAQRAQEAALVEALSPKYQQWLQEVALLITEEERRLFLELDQDYHRDAFIERFWRVRDPHPETSRNELRDRWYARLDQARSEFGSLEDERAHMLLLNGPPTGRAEVRCTAVLWPIEVWFYDRHSRIREELYLVFYQRLGRGHFVIWHPSDGVQQLFQTAAAGAGTGDGGLLREIQRSCIRNADALIGTLSRILRDGLLTYPLLLMKAQQPPERPSAEWLATFESYSTDLPAEASTFPAELSFDFPGRHQTRTVVQGTFQVPREVVEEARLGDARSVNLLLTGEILRGQELFDRFRYKFDFPSDQLQGEVLPLVFQRHLRPGEYRVVTRLEDINGKSFHRVERELEVPWLDGMAPAELDAETAAVLEEADALLSALDPSVKILPPLGRDMQVGRLRFDAEVTGPQVARVVFSLGGQPVLEKRAPPWSVSLDLGQIPRTQVLRVAALSVDGEELAADEMMLNAGSHRFAVRLLEPRPGQRVGGTVPVVAQVQVPEGERVERLELYVGEELAATLFQPPYDQPLRLPEPGALTYLRAVAYLPDGNSTDSMVFVNAPEGLEHIDVQMVELFASVTDRRGQPVEGLDESDFRVLEDGVEQTIRRFEKVTDLPFHASVLLDISGSMVDSLEMAQEAALSFLQQAVGPRDRAAIFTFNDRPQMVQGFTNDLLELGGSLAGLRAERGTALYDSLIMGLHYFGGIRGQRALLLLSDGEDTSSRFDFAQTLEYARRSGVTIYSIGLKIRRTEMSVRRELQRLAEETGGRSYFIDDAADLKGIYATIEEELRSQYLIAYQSTNTSGDDGFRSVDLQVRRPGLTAQTLRGYYP